MFSQIFLSVFFIGKEEIIFVEDSAIKIKKRIPYPMPGSDAFD